MGIRSRPFKLTSPELLERDVKDACIDLLAARGYKAYRLHAGIARWPDGRWLPLNPKGTADYVVLHGQRRGFLLETKRPAKPELRAAQEFMRRTMLHGYGIPTVRAATARELLEWLDQWEANK